MELDIIVASSLGQGHIQVKRDKNDTLTKIHA